ncbi:hypothetical protein [Pedobacter sp. Bi36]|nr:hypothetical protein [Pedobacter sp. Bi36]CAH0266908.1 hypothetical protein SRABI36_03623 [Pedobacter sp. Bi36]CAH0293160.1 hypothetical protein SRABI126_04117 [Pedobacter sp. Bi126]
MDYEPLYTKLDSYHQMTSPLKAYLKVILREIILSDAQVIGKALWSDFPITFIHKGTLKTKLESKIEPGKSILLLHFEGLMLPQFLETNLEDFDLRTSVIGGATLMGIPSGHIYNLYKLFPEFHKIIEKISLENCNKLFHLAFDIKNLKAEDRFAALLEIHPNVFQLASSIDIADSTGMHAHTLSTLKGKYLSGGRG